MKVFNFVFIYFSITVLVAIVFRILFYKVDNNKMYDTVSNAIFYTFGNPLGNFYIMTIKPEMHYYEKEMIHSYNICIFVFMFFMMIMMVNVLVAILSNVYTEI